MMPKFYLLAFALPTLIAINAFGYGDTPSRFTAEIKQQQPSGSSVYCVKDREQGNEVRCSRPFNPDDETNAQLELMTNALDQDESGWTSLPPKNFAVSSISTKPMQEKACGSWAKRIALRKAWLEGAQKTSRDASCPVSTQSGSAAPPPAAH
jgi:hypothetical protein